jgi:hypothetical protein
MKTARCYPRCLWALIPLGLIATGAAAAEWLPPAEAGKPAKPSAAALKLLEYREPVNGLVARIEGIQRNYYLGKYVVVRLENRGKTPLEVPTRNPADPKKPSAFSLWGRDFGQWKLLPWRLEDDAGAGDGFNTPLRTDPIWTSVTLRPGESVLAFLGGCFAGEGLDDTRYLDPFAEVAVVLYQERATGKDAWTGKLQTPPYPIYTSGRLWGELAGQLPMPTHFPPFRRERVDYLSGSGREGDLTRLRTANWARVFQLDRYRPDEVARELQGRIADEKDGGLQKLYTALIEAAEKRRAKGETTPPRRNRKYHVAGLDKDVDARDIPMLLDVLKTDAGRPGGGDPQQQATFQSVVETLIELRVKEAVPVLLQHLDRAACIDAVGELGDRRAIADLQKVAKAHGRHALRAKVAIAKLDAGDPAARYAALLADKSLSGDDKETVASLLEESRSPLAIPHLVTLIKDRRNCRATLTRIHSLGQIKDVAAAEALMRCFDFDYSQKTKEPLGMYHIASEADYPKAIAESLRELTGANIGTNPAHWRKWWYEEGKKGEWLK